MGIDYGAEDALPHNRATDMDVGIDESIAKIRNAVIFRPLLKAPLLV